MTRHATASNTNAPLDPPCTRDAEIAAEREQQEIADVKSILFGLRSFCEEAEVEGNESLISAMWQAIRADDAIEAHRLRKLVWSDYADARIAGKAQGIFHPISAANIVKREFQRDEIRFNHSAGNASPRVADRSSPGEPAERPLSTPQDHAATPGPADLSSTDRRDAA